MQHTKRTLLLFLALLPAYIIMLQATPQPVRADEGTDRIAVLITGWGMPSNYNFNYAWTSHNYPRVGDLTEYEGQPCKIGHVGEFPYQSHINFMPWAITFETAGYEWAFDSYGLYKYDSENDLYISSCPDAENVTLAQIPDGTPITPLIEWQDRTGAYKYPPDPRDGTNYVADWYKIGDYDNPFPNGCGDLWDEGPTTYLEIVGYTGGDLNNPDDFVPNPYNQAQDEYTEQLLEESFGDRIDVRHGYYTAAPGHTKMLDDVAEEFVNDGFTKMLISRETTDHNRYANEFMSGNYIKERLCELGVLDDMEIYQNRQVGRTPEFNTMNIQNITPFIQRYPEGSTIGLIYVTRGLTWGQDESAGATGMAHPWSKEVYHENAYLNYLSWKKALRKEFGDAYTLVFTRKGQETDLREKSFYTYGLGNDIDLKGYGGETVFFGIREAIQWAVEDGLDKIIIAPCHWNYDNLDTILRMKELNNLPLTSKADIAAATFEKTHCEDIDGNEVVCESQEKVVEITTVPSYSHFAEEFGTSYYVVLRGTLERFGLYPQDELFWEGTSQEVTKRAGGTVAVDNFFSFINGSQIVIPGDPYPDRPDSFTPETAIAPNDPLDTNDCMWEDTEILIKHRLDPPSMKSGTAVGPAVHFGPYRSFFNRDVTITIPYWWFLSFGRDVTPYVYNHVTEDWDALEAESTENGLVTFKTTVLGLFQAGLRQE